MTTAMELPRLQASGIELDTGEVSFGFLRSSSDIAEDTHALQSRIAQDGYLFLPGLLDREEVLAARQVVLERAEKEGILDPAFPVEAGILKAKVNPYFRPEYTQENAALMRVLYDGPMIAFFERYFGEPVRHFDFTWLRAVGPGHGTAPHCDVVYMGRGTHELCTAWTPLGDIPLAVGGLMVLENSHRRQDVLGDYLKQDVDSYCENGPNAEKARKGEMNWEHWDGSFSQWDGSLTHDPPALRRELGGRWLTCPEYRMGDVLVFTMRTVHASIDNTTQVLRLSTDTRYQPASQPADERWIGAEPAAHSAAIKRGRIC